MKPFAFVRLIGIAMIAFVTTPVANEGRITATTESGELTMAERPATVGRPAGEGSLPAVVSAGDPASSRNNEQIWRRIHESAASTYINEILDQRDSSLARWPERPENPPRVWVGTGDELRDWDSTHVRRVRDAFQEWSSAGIPVRFTVATDSANADIHVMWTDHFTGTMHGKTVWVRDRHWWIVNGTITIALHRNTGEVLGGSAIKAIALHEVGHLLGLDHTMDATNIMTPMIRVHSLSEADRATLRLLYSLPPGSLVEKKAQRRRSWLASIPAFLGLLF
jgi:Matrixin